MRMRILLSLSMALTVLACGSIRRDGFADPASSPDAPPGDGMNGGSGVLGDAATRDAACAGGQPATVAQDITIDPAFSDTYRAFDLGEVPGMPKFKYGGMTLAAGDENRLLIGGAANESTAAIYAVTLIRSACKHIVGFAGPAQKVAEAPYIDGGLVYGPGNVLMFAAWPREDDVRQSTSGMVGFLPPGASAPARTVNGMKFGMPEALAALGFVPPGFPGQGRLKLVTWEGGSWYDASLALDSQGRASDLTSVSQVMTVPGGPEGFAYVPQGSPRFDRASMLVSEWSRNSVAAYDVGPSGDPELGARKTFLTGLAGAEGAFFDPPTGDFIFSTWNLHRPERVVIVLGFVPVSVPR